MHPTRERIDTKAGITAALGNGETLAGFTALAAERRRWVKENPSEPLDEWYVLNGRIYLDKFGQTHTVTFESDIGWVQEGHKTASDPPGSKRPGLRITWSSRSIPRDFDRCVHCDGEITVRQLSKIYVGGHNHEKDRLLVFHGECRTMWLDEHQRDEFSAAFKKAELAMPTLYSMPSHYTETDFTGPWYRVESPQLGRLLIGWRKSVINLSWDDSAPLTRVDGTKLFAAEGVTTGTKHVHAWGPDKLAEYLQTLHRAVS
jgi:hypothetical protein